MLKYLSTLSETDCYGCRACEQACHIGCITMDENEEGFLYPKLNYIQCTSCGLCERVCPIMNDVILNKPQSVWAVTHSNLKKRMESSSGGAFSAIASIVFSKGGVVYGAAFDENYKLFHKAATTEQELLPLKGSKYIQSDIGAVYQDIRRYLKNEKLVCFVGTPCQVAGLLAFLGKKYANLITVDLVCHGVPSNKLFIRYIHSLQKKHASHIFDFKFRDKSRFGWGIYYSYAYIDQTGNVRKNNFHGSFGSYGFFFDRGASFRRSCYSCKYASNKRVGDITLADFWGVHHFYPKLDLKNGVSLYLANTTIGDNVFKDICNQLHYYPASLEDATQYNHNLRSPSNADELRESVYTNIDTESMECLYKREYKKADRIWGLCKIWGIYIMRLMKIKR